MARRPGAKTRVWKRQPRARDRAWQSMRILRRFTLPDLCATAEIGLENAKKYMGGLWRAGYLRRIQECRSGHKGGHAVWMLVRDTGPQAPRLQRDGGTYDPNLHQVFEGGLQQ